MSATSNSAQLILGRYRVLERNGDWRLATVYTANDERLQRKVLIHLLRKELVGQEAMLKRFAAEAALAARRSHPALLEIFDSGEIAGRSYMVTEHISGRSLYGIGALTIDQALLYMRQVIGAVALCQSRASAELPLGLPHAPISSQNVWLVDEGQVKLIESWLLPLNEVTLDMAHYRPPERTQGLPANSASVVYSLGVLLYELITGRRPFSGNDPRTIAAAHVGARLPPLSNARPTLILPSLERIVAHALEADPAQRYPDAQVFGEALEGFWREQAGSTHVFAVNTPASGRRIGLTPAVADPPRRVPMVAQPAQAAAQPAQPMINPASAPGVYDEPQVAAPTRERPPLAAPAAGAARPQRQTVVQRLSNTGWLRPLDRATIRELHRNQSFIGSLVLVVLLLGTAFLSYNASWYLVDNWNTLRMPSLPSLPSFGNSNTGGETGSEATPLPTAVQIDPANLFYVNIGEGLNLRDAAGLNTQIVTILPNATLVERLEGPNVVDGVPWVRVRAIIDNRVIEGWVSQNFLLNGTPVPQPTAEPTPAP